MKTRFLAMVFAAMFPIGAIAQTAGDSPELARSGTNMSTEGSSHTNSASDRMHSRNEAKGFFHRDRDTARADTNTRFRTNAALTSPNATADGVVPDQGVALGLQMGAD